MLQNKQHQLVVVLAALLLVASCSHTSAQRQLLTPQYDNPAKSSVLILMFDDMRFDTFSYRGGPVATPHIDQLAASGTQFDYAMTTTGLCSPSRAAFFTGRWGHKTGLDDNIELWHSRLHELPPDQDGLIGRAVKAGYFTGYVGKWHLGSDGPARRGANFVRGSAATRPRFVRFRTPYDRDEDMQRYLAGERDKNGQKVIYYETVDGHYGDTKTAAIVQQGQEMIRRATASGKPLFGVISFHQPHPPYHVPEPYASMYPASEVQLPSNHNVKRRYKPLTQDGIYWPWHDTTHMTETDWRESRAHYYGAVAMVDRAIGEILATAKEEGLMENLTTVLIGDQGSMIGEHQLFDKGPYAYDELMRIPLIIKTPSLAPQRIRHHVSLIDVAPTLLETMQLNPDDSLDGQSLLPFMRLGDNANVDRDDSALYAYEWYNGSWFGIRAIRTHHFKYVWNASDARDELYDLRNDPGEIVNVVDSPQYAEDLEMMLGKMDQALSRTADPSLDRFRYQMSHREN